MQLQHLDGTSNCSASTSATGQPLLSPNQRCSSSFIISFRRTIKANLKNTFMRGYPKHLLNSRIEQGEKWGEGVPQIEVLLYKSCMVMKALCRLEIINHQSPPWTEPDWLYYDPSVEGIGSSECTMLTIVDVQTAFYQFHHGPLLAAWIGSPVGNKSCKRSISIAFKHVATP